MPLLVWSTWRTGSRTQFSRGEWALCMQSATWEWVWVQNSGYSSSCVGHRHHPNPWASCSSQGSHFWSPDPSTSLTGRSHPARAELLTLQHFNFHQKYKSAPEVLSFENKAPHRPRGSFLGSLMKSLGGVAEGRAGTAGSRVSVENKLCILAQPHQWDLCFHQPAWAWAHRIFSFPGITSLLLLPYFPHSLVPKMLEFHSYFQTPTSVEELIEKVSPSMAASASWFQDFI